MEAALAACRKALVGTGMATFSFSTQTGVDKPPLPI